MSVKCKNGSKPRYRFRNLKNGGKQRLAFCGGTVIEIATFKNGKKIKIRRLKFNRKK